ncbi:MAG: DHH family phosphoesterase [Bdellovibrionales bacterium]|nr:DHH family phosphoesterase [Bdellovibrionales bacterium]
MGFRFQHWEARVPKTPKDFSELGAILFENRSFSPIKKLDYGDHGLEAALHTIRRAIAENKKVALYADYDVDGTMSCVSWIWFFQAIGFSNFVHYIPCRFKEGYGLNLDAVKYLVEDEKAELIITMDTGITANEEAAYCAARGVGFVCTDHHKIQPDKMPNCIILNPKLHPEELYQELCGCGITFVLLRRLAEYYSLSPELWTDLLALAGLATICDIVPLNPVNHELARLGVRALMRSRRPVLRQLREAASLQSGMDEKDVGFRLGPRINAVGRLGHADQVVRAFVEQNPAQLIDYMDSCNAERKTIQARIVREASAEAKRFLRDPVLFLGGDWHPGVVGIAASKIAETYWRPTWLFERKDGRGKGSARSIPGFDVTEAMQAVGDLFIKFGGHRAAGGFTFDLGNEEAIREKLNQYAAAKQRELPKLWESTIQYDCTLPVELAELRLAEELETLKPFGHGFEEPRFLIEAEIAGVQYFKDKRTGEPKHTAVMIRRQNGLAQKILFFNEVFDVFESATRARFVVSASRNEFRGQVSLSLMGHDYEVVDV